MKRNITLLAIALLGIATFTACKKKTNNTTGSMSATIKGGVYTGTSFNVSMCTGAVTGTQFIATAFPSASNTHPVMTVTVGNYTGTGTYTIDGSTTTAVFEPTDTSGYASSSGTITITSASSKSISGTFNYHAPSATNFNAADTINVSNGTFTCILQ